MVLPQTEIASTKEMGFVATSKEDLARGGFNRRRNVPHT